MQEVRINGGSTSRVGPRRAGSPGVYRRGLLGGVTSVRYERMFQMDIEMADHHQAPPGREDPGDPSGRRRCYSSDCVASGTDMAAWRGCQAIARGEVVSGQNGAGGDVGLVLGGGGARGAYTSGALSVLLPELKDQVRVIVGTSAGALIASYLVANWHRPTQEAVEDGLQVLARFAIRGRVRAADGARRRGSVYALRRRVSARQQHARPVDPAPRTAAADACKAGGLRPAGREHPRAAAGARGGRGPRLRQPVGRVSPGRDSATPRGPVARDRVRRDPRPGRQSTCSRPRRSRRCSRPCA